MESILFALTLIAQNDPDSFDLDNMREQGIVEYMCLEPVNYSNELKDLCKRAGELRLRGKVESKTNKGDVK